MDRFRRVDRVWSWLPAFRAVGETEHLRRAAEALHISPSALSRTVGLVEEDVGTPLFRRAGRGINLTEEGTALLDAIRDAMRIVHDALGALESDTLSGRLSISAPGTITRMFVLPALAQLRRSHPGLHPALISAPHQELGERLRRGELDVALTTDPVIDPALSVFVLGSYSSGIYCGREHPLFRKRRVTIETAQSHPFVAPPVDARGYPREGWPVELTRRVEVEVSELQVGVDVCRAGQHLAVLPDGIAQPEIKRGDLARLPIDLIPDTPFFACHRRTTGRRGFAEPVVDAVLEILQKRSRRRR